MVEALQAALAALSGWEVAAVVLAIAYLLLAVREHPACWPCALASTAIYTVLLWHVSLLMESALNVYYIAMAVYGWWAWRRGDAGNALAITSWRARQHAVAIGTIAALTLVSGAWLSASSACSASAAPLRSAARIMALAVEYSKRAPGSDSSGCASASAAMSSRPSMNSSRAALPS